VFDDASPAPRGRRQPRYSFNTASDAGRLPRSFSRASSTRSWTRSREIAKVDQARLRDGAGTQMGPMVSAQQLSFARGSHGTWSPDGPTAATAVTAAAGSAPAATRRAQGASPTPPRHEDRARGDLGRWVVAARSGPRRDRAREKRHRVRPRRGHLDQGTISKAHAWPEDRAARCDQLLQRVRRVAAVGRVQAVRLGREMGHRCEAYTEVRPAPP